MKRAYKNRQMASTPTELQEFFYPKNVPPVTMKAFTKEEADAQLETLNKTV